jgi:hypothetical protein
MGVVSGCREHVWRICTHHVACVLHILPLAPWCLLLTDMEDNEGLDRQIGWSSCYNKNKTKGFNYFSYSSKHAFQVCLHYCLLFNFSVHLYAKKDAFLKWIMDDLCYMPWPVSPTHMHMTMWYDILVFRLTDCYVLWYFEVEKVYCTNDFWLCLSKVEILINFWICCYNSVNWILDRSMVKDLLW